MKIPRKQYADLFGPTTGDRVRLADTELLIEIEKDFTSYGDEAVFGGGKVLRDGMGQSARATNAGGALDTVIDCAVDNGAVQDCRASGSPASVAATGGVRLCRSRGERAAG